MQKCIPAAEWIPRSTVSILCLGLYGKGQEAGKEGRVLPLILQAENSVPERPRDKSRLIQGVGKGLKQSLKWVSVGVLFHDAAELLKLQVLLEKEIHWARAGGPRSQNPNSPLLLGVGERRKSQGSPHLLLLHLFEWLQSSEDALSLSQYHNPRAAEVGEWKRILPWFCSGSPWHPSSTAAWISLLGHTSTVKWISLGNE